jgi:membrane-associated phospholipid phosphatase
MSRATAWVLSFSLTIVLVVISYEWLDQPIAYFAHADFHGITAFPLMTRIPEWLSSLCVAALVIIGLRALMGRPLSRLETVVLLSGISLAVAATIKDQLKMLFGRTWPETWINNNPSLISDGVYGFNPFHGGIGYASFPSGHTTAVCAVVSVYWICYPQFRALYVAVVAAVVIGLLGADFHFLGDIIAGGFLGASTGWMTVLFWETGEVRQVHPPKSHGSSHVPATPGS